MTDNLSRKLLRALPPRARHGAVQTLLGLRESFRAIRRTPSRASRWLTQLALETLPREPAPPLDAFLRQAHEDLLGLQRRQYLMEAFDREWAARTRGRTCTIHNDIVLQMAFDVSSKNVIDLASWAIGAADRGRQNISNPGLLGYVKRDYLTQFPPVRAWRMTTSHERASLARLTDDGYCSARARLFPRAARRDVKPSDVDRLIDVFNRKAKPVVDDRNKNHAHAYENRTHGTAARVTIAQMRDLYTYTWSILNDLGLMAFGSTWAQNDMNHADSDTTARELVDMVFLPEWFQHEMTARGVNIATCYDALHENPASGDFNAQPNLVAVADRSDWPTAVGGSVTIRRRTLRPD